MLTNFLFNSLSQYSNFNCTTMVFDHAIGVSETGNEESFWSDPQGLHTSFYEFYKVIKVIFQESL